jgi:hypothetical protein
MADDPEARTQLARLARDARLRELPGDEIVTAVEARFDAVVDGLIAEAADSDDVSNKETALQYLEGRLSFFEGLLSAEQRARLKAALRAKISSW